MELNEFIKNVAEQFDNTDSSVFTGDTQFTQLDEWSSLVMLAIWNMIVKKYKVKMPMVELITAGSVQELYDLVNNNLCKRS